VVVPAVVKQSTDLAGRMVEEFYYEDVNANVRYDRGEPILYPAAPRPSFAKIGCN